MQQNNSFVNPFSSVKAIDTSTRKVFYNCQLKDFTFDKWICIGPYNDIDDADKCIGFSNPNSMISTIMLGDGSISDKINIRRKLIEYTFPDVTFAKPLVITDKN